MIWLGKLFPKPIQKNGNGEKQVGNSRCGDLDTVSAIWILACNDENPIITYEGIPYRLGLTPGFDIKRLVGTRAELFRHGIPSQRLRKWKEEMRAGKHLPAWIRDVDDEKTKAA